jgi:hypothetical protein
MGDTSDKDNMRERAWNQAAGNLIWPMLSRTNYQEWSVHVQCNLEAMYLWDAIVGDKIERRHDRLALGAILRGVPGDMHSMLLSKKSAKEAWGAIKSMRLGAERVKEVNAQKLLAEFESISFKPGESIDDFAVRIGKLATDLKGLGENSVDDTRVVKKFLRVVPAHYNQVAVTMEMFCDLKTLTVEELVGRLRAAEDRFEVGTDSSTDKAKSTLLLTEDEWMARNKSRMMGSESSSSGGKGGGHFVKKDKAAQRSSGNKHDRNKRDPGVHPSSGTPRRNGRCKKCGVYGHWAKECLNKRSAKEDHEEAAHHAVGDVEKNPALLVAHVCNVVRTPDTKTHGLFLNQKQVFPSKYAEGAWVLDTGATNHMTGCRASLADLDESVRGAVKFGDGSTVEICGVGAVTMSGKNQEHRVLTEVYFIPSLKCNIVSLGQLEEAGCRVEIDKGVLEVFAPASSGVPRPVVIRAERRSRLYIMNVNLTSPVCLLSKIEEEAWRWHARFGHLNFRALQSLGSQGMVDGLPMIKKVEQVCDGCALGKQHRTPFPQTSTWRASQGLELVHTDLCGQVSPATPGGKSYFMLIVDDYSRYMWIELLENKSEALVCFKKFRAAAELESGHRLRAFRTDRGGEFNSRAFVDFCDEHGIKHSTTTPYTPQQNGVVERRNQTVVEMAHCLLKSMKVPS